MAGSSTDEFGWNLDSWGISLTWNQKGIIILVAIVVVLAAALLFLSVLLPG